MHIVIRYNPSEVEWSGLLLFDLRDKLAKEFSRTMDPAVVHFVVDTELVDDDEPVVIETHGDFGTFSLQDVADSIAEFEASLQE